MTDHFRNFSDIQRSYRADTDFRIRSSFQSDAAIILAIHAGGIEMGCSELALAIAGQDFSLYMFEGIISNSRDLHLTSTNFDEPTALDLVQKHRTSLSLHGFAGLEGDPLIYLGGTDLVLVRRLLESLLKSGYPTRVNTGKFAATDPENICNRTSSGKGAQIEISDRLRSQFFENYLTQPGRKTSTPQFQHFVQVIRQSMLSE